jgi:protein phosphatase
MKIREIRQITRDHTVAEMYVEQGAMSQEDADSSKWRHVLWNVLGGDTDELAPEVYGAQLCRGDTVLLCTDGLSNYISSEQMVERLRSGRTSESTCQQLVSDANDEGGRDNITVVMARFLQNDRPLEQREASVDREQSNRTEDQAETVSCILRPGTDA